MCTAPSMGVVGNLAGAVRLVEEASRVGTDAKRISSIGTSAGAAADTLVDAARQTRASDTQPLVLAKPERRLAPGPSASSVVAIATSPRQVEDAWSLVHAEYVRSGILAQPKPGGIHAPEALLDGAPYVLTRVDDGRVVATLSVIPDAAAGLPADRVAPFAAALAQLRASGAKVMELGMFARQNTRARVGLSGASLRSDSNAVGNSVQALFSGAFAVASSENATHLVVTVHPNHVAYYTKLFGFRVLAPEAAHPSVDGARAVLLVADTGQLRNADALARGAGGRLPDMPGELERRSLMRAVARNIAEREPP